MEFGEFAALCYELEKTPGRLAKIAAAAKYLIRLNRDEIRVGVAFLSGRPFPVSDPRTLDIGPSALAEAYSIPETGDGTSPLALIEAAEDFGKVAEAAGKGSRKEKFARLKTLIEKTGPQDRPILFRILHNELRIGLHDGLILEAIAKASGASLKTVRRAALFLSDLAEVATIALAEGPAALEAVDIKLFVPLLPMLSELSEDFDEVFKAHGGATALEFKYDGARIQIHKQGDRARIWSRRLTEVTASIPEIGAIATNDLAGQSFILDGEVVAVGKDGRPFPFQELMRRFRRVHGIETAAGEIPLRLYLFDCLYLDDVSLIDEPYETRWRRLERLTRGKHLARRFVTGDKVLSEAFLNESLASGHEGLMAKALDSTYMPGNRGKLWFKIKPAETVDCVIIAADRGSGRRRGWLSNYHLAVGDGQGGFAPVGKTFKGLTDQEFTEMTERLQALKLEDDGYTVFVRPEVVVEVTYNEIQRSPQYSSGFALRFARIARIRDDKDPSQATTLAELQMLYDRQFVAKSRR
ncbi:MAG TPA: ATP-dependent DNA ligase [Verrucomicrobiae bacterium]|jgi:DNA ligase-1|nr:ATP-dependent DNA ligase [Verrucomicrobiae bacterium]